MQLLANKGLHSFGLPTPSRIAGGIEMNAGVFTAGIQSVQTFSTIATTNSFNSQFHNVFNELNTLRHEYQQQVNELLAGDAEVKDVLRNKGVSLAWKYEQAELQMDGGGSRDWSDTQKREILEHGKVRGAEGHHINNVSDHLYDQTNPDNIKFAKTRAEHQEMHGGDFRNPTSGEHIDRNERLTHANVHRVARNEWSGIGMAAAIGLSAGFTIGFTVKLAQSGLSIESLKHAAIAGAKASGEGALLGVVNHLVVRSIGEAASSALQGAGQNIGMTVTENLAKMCNMAVMGGMAVIVFSVYQFCKLKLMGFSTKECLLRVGKSAAFSVTVLVLSIVAQGLWGGCAGLVVSVGIGFVVLTYKIGSARYNQMLVERIRIYTMEKYRPIY